MARIRPIVACLLIVASGCSYRSESKGPANVVGFHLPSHAVRMIRKGQHYDTDRSVLESRLQKQLGMRLTVRVDSDGVLSEYESRQGRFLLQLTGTRTGLEQATLRLHRVETLSDAQKQAREREVKLIAQILLLGDDGSAWVCEAACGSVASAVAKATEVHEFGKTTYALKAFALSDAEIDNEKTNPRLWISIGPHIEFEQPEPPKAEQGK